MKCPLCEKEFTTRTTLSVHLKKFHNLDDLTRERLVCDTVYGKEVVDMWIEKYKNCEICFDELGGNGGESSAPSIRNLIVLMGLKRTSSEERMTERYKEKYLSGIQKKYGKEITNVSQVKEVQKKKEDTYSKQYGSYDNYLANCRTRMKAGAQVYWNDSERKEIAKIKYKETLREKYGENITNVAQIPDVSQKISKRQKDKYSNMNSKQRAEATEAARKKLADIVSKMSDNERKEFFKRHNQPKNFTVKNEHFVSSHEKRIWDILFSLNILFQHNCFIYGMNFDIVFSEYHIALEIQGDYWHCNPKIYNESDFVKRPENELVSVKQVWERDEQRKNIMNNHGWEVRYLWEDEINACADTDKLLVLLKETVPEIFVYNN